MNRFNWGVLGVSGHFRSRILVPLSTSQSDRILAIASRNGDRARRWGFPSPSVPMKSS